MEYRLNKKYLSKICDHQYNQWLSSLGNYVEESNDLVFEYEDKNYLCKPQLEKIRDSKIQAISLFSGCGGLDIGTQMAGVKVISTLDFEPATVATVKANPFFSLARYH